MYRVFAQDVLQLVICGLDSRLVPAGRYRDKDRAAAVGDRADILVSGSMLV